MRFLHAKEQLSNKEYLYRTMHCTWPSYRFNNHGLIRLLNWVHLLKSPASVLEIGCGNGKLCETLSAMRFDVTGLDITEGPYERDGYNFVKHDITQGLPFEDDEFDYCLSFDVLEHLQQEQIENVLKDMFRVGCYVILTIACHSRGVLHQTVRPPEWWVEKLNRICPGPKDRTFRIYIRPGTTEQTVLFFAKKEY